MIVKNNHHLVWKHYLRKWSKDLKDVYYITPVNRKIARDSVNGLAMTHQFYKCTALNSLQIEFIRMQSLELGPDAHSFYTKILNRYLDIQKRQEIVVDLSIQEPEILKRLEALNANFLENLHAQHENYAKSTIDKLSIGDLTPLDDGHEILPFLMYLGHQFVRTNAFKQGVYLTLDEEVREFMDGAWWFASYMMGGTLGSNLYRERSSRTVCLLHNTSAQNFITSDHPVINMHPDLDEGTLTPPTKSDLFFPLSPRYAFMINDSDQFPRGSSDVDSTFVQSVNERISKSAEASIFGLEEADIAPYRNSIGARLDTIRKASATRCPRP